MAITSIGTPTKTGTTGTGSPKPQQGTYGTGQTRDAADLLVALVTANGSTSAGTITEQTTQGWTKIYEGSGTTVKAAIFTLPASQSSATAPTFQSTIAGTSTRCYMNVTIYQLHDDTASGNIPMLDTGNQANGTTSLSLSTAASVAGAGEYALAAIGQQYTTSAANTWGAVSGWTQNQTDAATAYYHFVNAINGTPASGSALSYNPTHSTSSIIAGAIAVFKAGIDISVATGGPKMKKFKISGTGTVLAPSAGVTPPVLSQYAETDWMTLGGTSKATPSITWQAGDLIVAMATNEGGTNVLGIPTFAGGTFAAWGSDVGGDSTHSRAASWTCQPVSGGSGAVTFTNGVAQRFGGAVWVFHDHGGTGVRAAVADTTQSVSLARGSDHSAVVMLIGDYSASTVVGTWIPAGFTSEEASSNGINYGVYVADWGDQGTAGTTTYGRDSGSGAWSKIALEIKGKPIPAVAFDTASHSQNQAIFNHVNNTAGNAILIAAHVVATPTGAETVTYGGVTIPFLGYQAADDGQPTGAGIALYGKIGGLPTGSNAVVLTGGQISASDFWGGAASYANPGSFGTVFKAHLTTPGSAGNITVTGTTNGGLCIAGMSFGSNADITPTAPAAERWKELRDSNGNSNNGHGLDQASNGSNVTIAWTSAGTDWAAMIAVEILPAGGAPEVSSATGAPKMKHFTVAGSGAGFSDATGAPKMKHMTIAATGSVPAELSVATGAVSMHKMTAAGTGAGISVGTGAPKMKKMTIAAASAGISVSTGAVSMKKMKTAGTGAGFADFTGAVKLKKMTVAASGSVLAEVSSGTIAVTMKKMSLAGAGAGISVATGAPKLKKMTIAATGQVPAEQSLATAAVTMKKMSLSGSGAGISVSSGGPKLKKMTVSGAGAGITVASGGPKLKKMTVAAASTGITVVTGGPGLKKMRVSGSGAGVAVVISGPTLKKMSVAGTGTAISAASGAVRMKKFTIMGIEGEIGILSGGPRMKKMTVSVTGTAVSVASGGPVLKKMKVSGSGAGVSVASGGPVLKKMKILGVGAGLDIFSGNVVLKKMLLAGTGEGIAVVTAAVTMKKMEVEGEAVKKVKADNMMIFSML